MTRRNENFLRLQPSYLFPEIVRRKNEFLITNPDVNLISLGIGDTTEPITPFITNALKESAEGLGTFKNYSGYGPPAGVEPLREQIASTLYGGKISPDEVFISDGAKCDIGRLLLLFGSQVSVAVQDPAYPVYVDGSILHGVKNLNYMSCIPEDGFFPDLQKTVKTDLICFCSPNNPTGACATKDQLTALVKFAKANQSIILFDSAYAQYIQDQDLPRSIFEIEGAEEVAIEVSSFSKIAGFTGVRLGWSIVPKALKYDDGQSVHNDWTRVISTVFNGASNIAQKGGIAALQPEGLREMHVLIQYYLENARIIKEGLVSLGWEVYGGNHAPFLWVRFKGRKSWDIFEEILQKAHIVTTPGSGFGSAGEGFIRLSAFGHRENILLAMERINKSKLPYV